MPPKPEQTEKQPGADRFWGQFSQSTAGRSSTGNGSAADPANEPGGASASDNSGAECLEWCPICRSAELFRHTVSPELRQQAESIQHEAMGVLKAFLDAYADKSGSQPTGGASGETSSRAEEPDEPKEPRVTEIPLD